MLAVQILSNFIKWSDWVQRYMQNKEKNSSLRKLRKAGRLVNKILQSEQSFRVRKRVKL